MPEPEPKDHRPAYVARLRALMEEAGETQYQLAQIAGVSQPAVARWMGGSVPFRQKLHAICSHYGVRPEWLVEGTGPKKAPESKSTLEGFPKDLRSDLAALGEAAQRSKDVRQVVAHLAHVFREK